MGVVRGARQGSSWVLPSLVKETLIGWHGSFLGKNCKKSWPPYVYFRLFERKGTCKLLIMQNFWSKG
ncbi:hypothetical protein CK203_089157 [Vitis vinifera]|uniref:Uncharacterized protein n=1 Tax=Vitis vinifera TaxID=29760 RepID=A0A438DUT3_VITVI|nr:hypothetical protein CK203_089157 [Vitis vinifera]